MGADTLAENTYPKCPRLYLPNLYAQAQKLWIAMKKGFIGRPYALSFYGSQNILDWSKFFVPYQKLIYILCQSQTFCAIPKDDFHIVNSVFVPAQNFLEGH